MHPLDETIAASASAIGVGAVAVIRVSGPTSLQVLEQLVDSAGRPRRWIPRQMHRAMLRSADGHALDDALAVWMPAPRSYTGQDMVEIHCHGNPLIVDSVLAALFAAGARQANAGEFTWRAFVLGKISLSQAEATGELVASRASSEQRLALAHLRGSVPLRTGPIKARLLALLRDLEAGIDFSEEEIEFVSSAKIASRIAETNSLLDDLLSGAARGRLIREGVRVVLAGEPNAGKSSLFNALLGVSRAIVTDIPGTTRDYLSESFAHGGIAFDLHDTAGLRDDATGVEALGVDQARAAMAAAAIELRVVDGSRAPTAAELAAISTLDPRTSLLLVSKSDHPSFDAAAATGAAPDGLSGLSVSAISGQGVAKIKDALLGLATGGESAQVGEAEAAINRRQEARLLAARRALGQLCDAQTESMDAELVASHIREAIGEINAVGGENVSDEVLAEIFSSFCIGK